MAKKRPRPSGQDQLDIFSFDPDEPIAPTLPKPDKTINVSSLAAAAAATPDPEPELEATAILNSPRQQRARVARIPVRELAERAAAAWHRNHAKDGITVPMGIAAGLTLLRRTARDGTDVAAFVLGLSKEDLVEFHRRIWSTLWMRQPYLVEVSRPIHDWLENMPDEPDRKVIDAVYDMTHTLIGGGLFNLTGDDDPIGRCDVDVLGMLLMVLRSEGARGALAEIHTPTEMADLMALMTIDLDICKPGAWLTDPAAGTGGILRAAALAMRLKGGDPAACGWHMAELDPIAAACSAVNAIVWGLGPNVLIYCGDTLTTGDTTTPAVEHRQAVLDHHHDIMSRFAAVQAIQRTRALLANIGASA